MFGLITSVAGFVVLAIIAYSFIKEFRQAQGTVWSRSVEAAKDSATFLWGYVLIFSGDILNWSVSASEYLNLPEVQTFIQTNIKAEYLGVALVAIGLVTLLARARTLFSR